MEPNSDLFHTIEVNEIILDLLWGNRWQNLGCFLENLNRKSLLQFWKREVLFRLVPFVSVIFPLVSNLK